jgi:hypothetical protein
MYSISLAGLKALILSQHDELVTMHERLLSRENEIEHTEAADHQAATHAVWTQVGEAGAADKTNNAKVRFLHFADKYVA